MAIAALGKLRNDILVGVTVAGQVMMRLTKAGPNAGELAGLDF